MLPEQCHDLSFIIIIIIIGCIFIFHSQMFLNLNCLHFNLIDVIIVL